MKHFGRKLFASIIACLLCLTALGTSTYAWFSMNKTVTVTGMQVEATAEGSLVIKTGSAPTETDSTVDIDFADTSATKLFASTHDSDFNTYANGLKYVNNQEEVDAVTGLKHGSTDLTFAAAVNATGVTYYKDYTVYIAAAGAAMETQDITVTITSPTGLTNLNGAVSVDFYYSTNGVAPTPSASNFAGTLNLAGKDPVTNDANTAKANLILNGTTGITIPKADGSSAIVVTMRVYVDGALKDTASSTYVKTKSISEIASQTLTIQFVASAHNNG